MISTDLPWPLPLLALLPWLGALVVAALPNRARRAAALLAGVTALAGAAAVLALAPAVFAGEVLRWSVPWLPDLGLSLGFRMDGLAWLFAALITGIGALVVLYAAWYLDPADPAARFFCFLLLFMGAMLGVVLADNLLLLVLFWELTSLSSFLLIGYWHGRADARQGARMALTITGAGGLCLLAGALLIGHIVGSTQLDVVLASGDLIRAHPLYVPALVLVLAGAFTKSAQFPFHFWLPHAMAAPTPVSAYLHSATMVKCGVFLLARLYPALGGSEAWFWIVAPVGLATLLVGAYVAIFQHDLKGLLAYSTISHLGLITLLFGMDEPLAVVAGVFHIINHATFKAGLFMSAGIIDHETGTRDMRRLGGLMRVMPFTATLGMVAAAAMAGVPLFNGFLSKEMFFTEAVAVGSAGHLGWLLPAGATVAGIFSVAYSVRFIHDTFFQGDVPDDLPKKPHEAPFFMLLPVGLLATMCLAVGLAPAVLAGPTLAVAAQAAVYGMPGPALPEYKLAIWHGLNLPLVMSLVAVVGGVLLYFGLQRFINLHRLVRLPGWVSTGGRDLFMMGTALSFRAAQELTDLLQSGSLQRYLALLVVMALAAGVWPFLAGDAPAAVFPSLHLDGIDPVLVTVWLIGMLACLGTVLAWRRRLLAVVLMGTVGLVVCLCFVWFSAPDLALTQLLVEVASVMLLMLALRWLPAESPPETRRRQAWRAKRDAVLALFVGLGVSALVWMVVTQPPVSISDYFLAQSLPLGGGSNVVNVIIVDFRGFDTLGEITVLVIAGLTVHALLAPVVAGAPLPLGGGEADRHPLMLQMAARVLLPFSILVAAYLFLRGHNLPGGGFIAGLVMALGLLLMHVSHGQQWVSERASMDYRSWMGWGLLLAGGTGIASWAFGSPFLTTTYDYPWLPGVGGVPLASASAFDLGVFLVVVGATVVMLMAMGRLSAPAGMAAPHGRTH